MKSAEFSNYKPASKNSYLPPPPTSSPRSSPYYYSNYQPQLVPQQPFFRSPIDAPKTTKEQVHMFRASSRKHSQEQKASLKNNNYKGSAGNGYARSSSGKIGLNLYQQMNRGYTAYDENSNGEGGLNLKRPSSTKNASGVGSISKNLMQYKTSQSKDNKHEENLSNGKYVSSAASKAFRPASNYKTQVRQEEYAVPNFQYVGPSLTITNSQSQGRLISPGYQNPSAAYTNSSGRQVVTPTQKRNLKQELMLRANQNNNHKPPTSITSEREANPAASGNYYAKGISQYQMLHEKLNSLENKIADMKHNLDKKKKEKESFLQKVQKRKPQTPTPQYNSALAITTSTNARSSSKEKTPLAVSNGVARPPAPPQNQASSVLKSIVTQVPKQNKELHSLEFNPYSPRHNIYYVSQIVRAYKQDKSLAREHINSSIQLFKLMERVRRPSAQQLASKELSLPKNSIYKDKKTVVFDLDETLIHCNESTAIPYDVKLPITFPTGEVIEAGINIRPYAFQIIKNLSKNFEVIVFTASHSCYANVVLDHLDPERKYIQHRLYRQNCFQTDQGMYVKDLRVLNRNLEDMVLVDNAAYSYAFQVDNGIPIIPYYEGSNDYELKALQTYIEGMLWISDVRDLNRKTFRLAEYTRFDNIDQLVQELYQNKPSA